MSNASVSLHQICSLLERIVAEGERYDRIYIIRFMF